MAGFAPAFKVGVHLNQTIYSDLQDYHTLAISSFLDRV
jgi:hypothetical protein